MGISAGGKKDRKSDINVTPLVDVVLVLLIIFIVTMPVLMKRITIEVPRELDEQEEIVEATTQISIQGKADGTVVVNDGVTETTVKRVDLANTLKPLLDEKKTEKLVFVDFEDELDYGSAVSILDTVRAVGAEKIAIKKRDKDLKNRQ